MSDRCACTQIHKQTWAKSLSRVQIIFFASLYPEMQLLISIKIEKNAPAGGYEESD